MAFGRMGRIGHLGDELGIESGPRDEVSLSDGSDKTRLGGTEAEGV